MAGPGWHSLVGSWTGTDRIWFDPATAGVGTPANESPAEMVVRPTLGGRGLLFEARWWMGEEEQFTTLVLVAAPSGTEGALIDTFHTGGTVMALSAAHGDGSAAHGDGSAAHGDGGDGVVGLTGSGSEPLAEARGSYEGEGETWGWHVAVHLRGHDEMVVEALNVEPGGAASLAVRSTYTRMVDPHDEVAV